MEGEVVVDQNHFRRLFGSLGAFAAHGDAAV